MCCPKAPLYLPDDQRWRGGLSAEIDRFCADVRMIDPALPGAREQVVELRYNRLADLREFRLPVLGCREEKGRVREAERRLKELSALLGVRGRRHEPGVIPRVERTCAVRRVA